MPIPHLAAGGAVRVDEVGVRRDRQLLAVEGRCLRLERISGKIVFISDYGTFTTIKARFYHWLSGKRPANHFSCSVFARELMRSMARSPA